MRQVLVHLLTSNANEVSVELKSLIRLESDVDLLFRLGVDNTFVIVEAEALVENLLNHVIGILILTFFRGLHHLELDVQIAVAAISNDH